MKGSLFMRLASSINQNFNIQNNIIVLVNGYFPK